MFPLEIYVVIDPSNCSGAALLVIASAEIVVSSMAATKPLCVCQLLLPRKLVAAEVIAFDLADELMAWPPVADVTAVTAEKLAAPVFIWL